jgi:hypothetical protein
MAVKMSSKDQGTDEFESNFEFVETPKASTSAFEKFEDYGGDDTLIIPIPPVLSSHRSFLVSFFRRHYKEAVDLALLREC